MRRISTLLLALVTVTLLAGCGAAGQNTDPYDLVRRATDAGWDRVQVEMGLSVTAGGETITIDKSAFRIVVDSEASKVSIHLAMPVKQLGADPLALQQLGISGDTLDFDALYDGSAFYAKSPLLTFLVNFAYAQEGEPPAGDLAGWLRLGTAAAFERLAQGMGGSAAPSVLPRASLDTKTLKEQLENIGVVLSFVATEQRNGLEANHLRATFDLEKLVQSEAFDSLNRTQRDQITALKDQLTMTVDLWTGRANDRIAEIDLHGVLTGQTAGTFDLLMTFAEPAPGTSFDPPASYVDIPIDELYELLMKLVRQNMLMG